MSYARPTTPGRRDVQRMLLARGWIEGQFAGTLRKGSVVWASIGSYRDSALSLHEGAHAEFTIEFTSEIPASVIVASCEAAAG